MTFARTGIWLLHWLLEESVVPTLFATLLALAVTWPSDDVTLWMQAIIARNRKLVGKAKEDAKYRCQGCDNDPGWVTSGEKPYVEVHHIIPLGENGFDDLRNMIVLCVNCHKMLHHAANRDALASDLREQLGLAAP